MENFSKIAGILGYSYHLEKGNYYNSSGVTAIYDVGVRMRSFLCLQAHARTHAHISRHVLASYVLISWAGMT